MVIRLHPIIVAGVILGITGSSRADDPAEARAVLDKAIKALGGEAKLGKIKAATWKGKGKFYGLGGEGIDYTGDWSFQGTRQFRVVLEIVVNGQNIKQTIVLNGDKGWIKINDTVMDMDKEMLTEQQEQLHANWAAYVMPLALADKSFNLSLIGKMEIDKRPAIGIRAASKGHRDLNLYYDQETGLLVKGEWRVKDVQGLQGGKEVTQEVFVSDYKDTEGIKVAQKVIIKWDGKLYVDALMNDLQFEEQLGEEVFAKP
jgi:hypothetical protein